MYELIELYRMGGWMMHVLLLLGLAVLAMSVVMPILAYTSGQQRQALVFTVALAGAGAVLALLGLLGESLGLSAMERALSGVNPDDAETIRAMGTAEAHAPLVFGLAVAIIPWMAAAVTLPRAAPRASALAVWGGVVLALGIGVLVGAEVGRQHALIQVGRALGAVDPSQRVAIARASDAAANARRTGGIAVGAPLAAIGIALVLAQRSRTRPEP